MWILRTRNRSQTQQVSCKNLKFIWIIYANLLGREASYDSDDLISCLCCYRHRHHLVLLFPHPNSSFLAPPFFLSLLLSSSPSLWFTLSDFGSGEGRGAEGDMLLAETRLLPVRGCAISSTQHLTGISILYGRQGGQGSHINNLLYIPSILPWFFPIYSAPLPLPNLNPHCHEG